MILSLLLLADASVELRAAVDRAEACVFQQADELAKAREAADVTIDAAIAACLPERANVRTALQQSIKMNNPELSSESAKSVEQRTWDFGEKSLRDRALVRLVRSRATNAQN